MKNKILVVEDDPDIANLLKMHLRDANFEVKHTHSGDKAVLFYKSWEPDLIILDIMLPKLDGLSVCREIRKQSESVSILMLTAKSTEFDRVLGLEMGADDYLTKPFSLAELMARVKALFRRTKASSKSSEDGDAPTILDRGRLQIDAEKHRASVDNQPIELTAREFNLLWFLARNPGRVYTRTQLLDSVWGYDHDGYEHTVNTHINRLRMKIEKDAAKPEFIQTVWGVGYKFTE